jgi:CRP/FNR family transcriptional regulator, cyclic AMP receptor protein
VEWALLDLVPDEDRRRFLSVARRRRFDKGEVVFHGGDPGDTLHFVATGRFCVRVETALGVTAMLALIGPGDYFGILALLDGTRPQRSASIVALERAETLSVRKDEFEELRHRFPAVNEMLLKAMGEQVRRLSDALVEAMYTPVETRVLRRLLDAARVWDGPVPNSVVPLTQEDLAELAGTTRPTTNKVLRQAEERGWIRVGRGRVQLLDPDSLVKRAERD